jgi:hypothetical protein
MLRIYKVSFNNYTNYTSKTIRNHKTEEYISTDDGYLVIYDYDISKYMEFGGGYRTVEYIGFMPENINDKNEQKYFISYTAYSENNNINFFNDIIYIDESITSELLEKVEQSFKERLNEKAKISKYYAIQIVNIVKI